MGKLYFAIQLIDNNEESIYRECVGISETDYIFSKIERLPFFEETYSISELKEIMAVNSKEKLRTANSLIEKINVELEKKSQDTGKFRLLMNDLCIHLDGRPLK